MLRSLAIAVSIGFLSGSVPALAAQSCTDWCLQNMCAPGAQNQTVCLNRCVAACQKKHPNG
jgi:hypothetical protein